MCRTGELMQWGKEPCDGIVIPSGFQAGYTSGNPVNVIVYGNPTSTTNGIVTGFTNGVANAFNLQRVHATPVIGISQQPLISKSYKYIDYLVPGLVGFSVLTSPMFALVNISSQYKRDKIFKQLSLTPLTKTEWLLSKIIWYVVLTIISFLLMTVTGTIGFGARLSFSLGIIPFLILGPFLFVSLGMLVGTVSKSVESAAVVGNLVTFPMMFLSGTFFPVATMPVYLQNIAHIRCLPCRGYSSDQSILSYGKPETLWMYVHRPTTDRNKLYLGTFLVGE